MTVLHAAQAAGIARSTHNEWLLKDPQYAADFEQAKESGIEELEKVAMERAKSKKSDIMIFFLLKAHRPGKYRERLDLRHEGEVVHVKRLIITKE
jgi:hypothetical protein